MIHRDSQKRVQRRQARATKIVVAVETSKQHQQPNRAHIKLSHRRHTGRKLPIHSTSYAVLFFLLVLTGVFLFAIGQQAVIAGPPIVDQGSINISGLVPGSPPANPAVILVPANETHFTNSIITVSGTCESGLLVEIMRNGAFAGSQTCGVGGTFSLEITIIPGINTLVARVSDSLGQYGPDSAPVKVYLGSVTPTTPPSPSSGGGSTVAALPFLIYTQPVQRGVYPKQLMSLAYTIDGGVSPYAVSIDWGDGSQPDIIALTKSGIFDKTHIYDSSGQFVVSLSGTDSRQNKATIQTIVVVNGTVTRTVNSTFGPIVCEEGETIICTIISSTNMLWPILMLATALTISFWMGERLVLHKYKNIIKSA